MRRLLFLLTLSLVGSCLNCLAADTFTCPVTKPLGVQFTPTGVLAGQAATLAGDEKLFTIFPGNWNYAQRLDQRLRIPKIVWGSKVFDVSKEKSRSSLTITGRRLDAVAPPLEFDVAHTAWIDKDFAITSEFFLPTLGCWEVTGHFHGANLKIVVDLKEISAELR